ncbi:MAG: fumarate hydratase C-terminal domain-containing protein [Candidatus Eisenbacteria bacterium]|nr:fumarate hydratase C-terminal domain-containing protein [Candidatus Eisenbacteria bacterium]
MIELKLPASDADIRKLKAGDEVAITGTLITARDAAHKYLIDTDGAEVRDILNGGMVYHCGPVVKKDASGKYSFVAAGPTTSIRTEPFEPPVIEKYHLRGVIGKGGMGAGTLAACNKFGCVYLSALGGLATTLARSVVEVPAVYKLEEFGVPEALWVIKVKGFPAVVTMDSHMKSIHDDIETASKKNFERLMAK